MKLCPCFHLLALSVLASVLSQCTPYNANGYSPAGNSQYLADYRSTVPTGLPMSDGTPTWQPQGYWDGDGVQGSASIKLVLAEQKAYFYKGGTLVGMSPISSGDKEHATPRGRYRISQKSPNHKSSLYGVIKNRSTGEIVNKDADTRRHRAGPGEIFVNAPMPYFMRFNGGIGMHTGHLPGYPASHGCIRMPDEMAKVFFENARIGTPVVVQ